MSEFISFGKVSNLSASDSARLSRVEAALPKTAAGQLTYSGSMVSAVGANSVLPNGQISPTAGVSNTGNTFPFIVQGQFGFAWDGSILTIYWDGTNGSIPFVVRRADGSQISIPSGNLAVSGLSAATAYSFAPFIAVAQPQSMSFVAGDVGMPRYAFSPSADPQKLALAAQTQSLAANERITNGLIFYTTGPSGGASAGQGVNDLGNNPYPGQTNFQVGS